MLRKYRISHILSNQEEVVAALASSDRAPLVSTMCPLLAGCGNPDGRKIE